MAGVYSLATGLVNDLDVTVKGPRDWGVDPE